MNIKPVINSDFVKDYFKESADITVSKYKINDNINFHVFCVDGLLDSKSLGKIILTPILNSDKLSGAIREDLIIDYLLNGLTYSPFVFCTDDYYKMIGSTLSGMVSLIFDNEKKAVVFDIRSFEKRSISEPEDEGVMKGSKESFVEVLRTNTSLIRRRLKDEDLVFKHYKVGELSQTDVAVGYINGLADEEVVNEVKKQIKNIKIKNLAGPAFIEEYLNKNKYSIFPQLMYTERPDRCSANLADGKVAVIVDGIPFVYLLPCQLVMLMQSPEDYGNHFIIASFLRLIRYLAMLITIFLPSIYIGATSFQSQMLPVDLAQAIQKSKINVAFSSGFEVIGLLIAFEILIEASLRLPKTVGTAMSILGGLVVGQAAVEANLLSPTVVVVVSIAGISGFMMANQDFSTSLRIIRFLLSILASFMGFFGIGIGLIILLTHLASLESYKASYLYPFVISKDRRLQDTIFRFPIKKQ